MKNEECNPSPNHSSNDAMFGQLSISPNFSENHFNETGSGVAEESRPSFTLSQDSDFDAMIPAQVLRQRSEGGYDEVDITSVSLRGDKDKSFTESDLDRRSSLQKVQPRNVKRQGSRIFGKGMHRFWEFTSLFWLMDILPRLNILYNCAF